MVSLAAAVLGHYNTEAEYSTTEDFDNAFIDFVYAVSGDNGVYGANIENDVFTMRLYNWNASPGEHVPPNFHHKESDLKIWWYKYAGREMLSNRPTSLEELDLIAVDCIRSVNDGRAKE